MNKVFLLIKTFFRQQYRLADASKKGKTILLIAVIALCMAPMAVLLFISFLSTGKFAAQTGSATEMLTFLILSTQMIVLFLGVGHLLNVIYLSKDTERLLALPVKPQTIFISKLLYVHFSNSQLLFLLTSFVPYLLHIVLFHFFRRKVLTST